MARLGGEIGAWPFPRVVAVVCLALSATCLIGSTGLCAVMDFESAPAGTLYGGAAGDDPDDVVFSEDGITMTVKRFFLGELDGFYDAQIGGRHEDLFPTNALALTNISVLFDFANVGFDVTEVTFEYRELGGASNFAVNNGTISQLASLALIPADVAPGVTATVADYVVTLTGEVDNFLVGGQELYIDNIVAIPEPTGLLLLAAGGVWLARHRRRKRTRCSVNGDTTG